jgi:hypothetical protein
MDTVTGFKRDDTKTRQKTAVTLAVLIILNLLVYFSVNTLITEELLYEHMTKQLDHDMAIEQIKKTQRTGFILLKYILQGLWIMLKLAGITLIIMLGLFAYNIKATFSEVFEVILLPGFIFLIPDVLKIVWFSLVQTNYQMSDLNSFPRFNLSELLIALDFTINEDFPALLKRLLKPITVINLLFCWSVAGRLAEIKTDNKRVFRATFLSFFTVLTVFNLVLHVIITSFAP